MTRLCLCLILSFVASVLADDPSMPFTGKVVKVTDGDTIHVLLDKETHKIRLLHIDAPESKQAFGTKANKRVDVLRARIGFDSYYFSARPSWPTDLLLIVLFKWYPKLEVRSKNTKLKKMRERFQA